MKRSPWKATDPLYRGDEAGSPSVPDPTSKAGVVAHVLYLGGRGRETPFCSTTESEDVAGYFARNGGAIWETSARIATSVGAAHIGRQELLQTEGPMVPLSCVNCCNNPLQLGPLGTAFGFCTRHRDVLLRPHHTTCGQLLRKDLLGESACRERVTHVRTFPDGRVVTIDDPTQDAASRGLSEKANGDLPADPVVEEVTNYGNLDTKIATMAALHRVPGVRAEVAMLSLSRGYLQTCLSRNGKWTSGLHLLFWTLDRLDRNPVIDATDLRGPIAFSIGHTIAVARWSVIALRLAFVGDVARAASREDDRVGSLESIPHKAVSAAPNNDPDRLLGWLARNRKAWSSALSPQRYSDLSETLHVVGDECL